MPNTREKLIRCLKYCASTTDTGNDCVACERWVYDCGSGHCVDDLMLQAAEALEQMRWIPVTERLPEKKGNYLGWTGSTFMVGYYKGNAVWWIWSKDVEGVDLFSHWMPLPESPKGE